MSLLPQIEGGYLVNQGMLLKVDDVNFDVVEIEGSRRQKKKYNYEPFQPKSLPTIEKHKRKLRSQSHDHASTGSDEDYQKEERTKKRKDAARSQSLAATDRPGQLSEESRGIFSKYASVAKAQKKDKPKLQSNLKSSDSVGEQHVRFDEQVIESYPEEMARETKPQLKPIKSVPGYLKQTRSYGNKVKNEMDMGSSPTSRDKHAEFATSQYAESEDVEVDHRRPSPGRFKATANITSQKERLHDERRRARLWRETSSDPGNTERSIQNDQVIKGRASQNRRKHPNANRHEERPKGADRGRRMQSLPSKKDSQDTDDRPVNSAPSKEQPKPDGPMPKVNTLVKKSPRDEKESPKPVSKEKEPVVETKMKDKPSPVTTEQVAPKPPPVQEHRPKPPSTKKPGTETSSEGTPAKHEEKKPTIKLPPDDHGPVVAPVETKSPSSQTSSKNDPNFKYYASGKKPEDEKKKSEEDSKEKPSPTQLRFDYDKSMKEHRPVPVLKGHQSRDVSPSKSPGRGRDASPSKSPRRDISPGKYLKRFEKAKTMTERTEPSEYSDGAKKKREVTIMDPKDVRKEMDIDSNEGFPQEYEMGYERRSKTFEEMTDEEKVTYYKHELKMKPEQIRELTFHPKTTAQIQINRAYTGMDTLTWSQKRAALKSPRRSKSRNALQVYKKVQTVPPSQRKSHMLSKLQGVVYRHINKVYGATSKNNREKQFFERLAQLQLKEYQQRYESLAENDQRQLEMKYKQREQLRHLRKKFEDDAWRRFMTQYVTSKVMESEYRDRSEYGLPNETRKPIASRNKRHIYTMTPKSRYRSNRKKYANLFQFSSGPEAKPGGKPLKFEGFDAIYIDTEDDQGVPTKKRQDVQALMEEAMDLLQTHDDDIDMDYPSDRRVSRKRSEPPMRHYGRPQHNASRFKPYSESRSVKTYSESRSIKPYSEGDAMRLNRRQRPKPKPKPRTIKDVVGKRNPAPSNRYKASEFRTMKQNLLKDSELLNRKQKEKERQPAKDNASSKSQEDQQSDTISNRNHRHDPPPDIQQVKPPEALTNTEKGPGKWRVENGNVHLEDPETQIKIDTEREKFVSDDTEKSPIAGKTHSNTTTTTKTVTTTTTTRISPDKKHGDSESVSETVSVKQDRRGSITSQMRGSVQSVHPAISRKPISRTPSMATVRESDNKPKPVQRTPSRASIMSVSQNKRLDITQPPRAPSRVSVTGENNMKTSVNGTGRASRTSAVVPNDYTATGRASRTSTVLTNNKSPSAKQETNGADRENGLIKVVDANTKSDEQMSNDRVTNGTGGSSPLTVALGTSNGRVSPVVNETTGTNGRDLTRTVVNRRPSISSNRLTDDKQRQSRKKSPTPSIRSRYNGQSPMRKASEEKRVQKGNINNVNNPITGPTVDVKKSEHMSEVVKEVIDIKNGHSPDKTNVNGRSRRSNDDTMSSTQGKAVQGRGSKDGSRDDRESSEISKVRDANLENGHGDTKMKREDYERKGIERSQTRTPRRSRSRNKRDRKRSSSRSKERKRSTSKEKKHAKDAKGKGTGKSSRFPDIDQKQNGIIAPNQSKTDVVRSERVDENVTERELTPKAGADQWKDLVQKYMRQPSPKIGKPETRMLLDASFDTDDDDDDIFARAQKRYALSISDAESDA